MHISQFHYLPLAPGFFTILVALFIGMVLIFAVLGALRHAYLSLGVTPRTAMLLLVGSLVGSYFNIPIAVLPPEQVQSDKVFSRTRLSTTCYWRPLGRLPASRLRPPRSALELQATEGHLRSQVTLLPGLAARIWLIDVLDDVTM